MAQQLLADVEDLATLTGKPATDPRLALALRRASNRFLGDTNRASFVAGTGDTAESHNGTGGPLILLRGAPVLSVASVAVDGAQLPVDAYQVDPDAGMMRRTSGTWPEGLGNIVVTYRHGYEEVPGDVEDVVLEHAATLASVMAYLQQEGGGATQASYSKDATVGVTAKWADAVHRYNLQGRG